MNNRKIKVLHFGLSLNRGGIETYLHKISSIINNENFSFSFINSTSSVPCFYEELSEMGCNFHKITPRRSNLLKNKRDLKKLFKENDFDILHFHVNTLSYIDPVLFALKNEVKIVIHSRNAGAAGSNLTQFLHRVNKFRVQLLGDKVTKVSVSQLAGEWLFGKNNNFTVYNNGIDLERFRFLENERILLRKELNIDDTTYLLGNVGAFVPAKNQEFAVKILKGVVESGIDAKLLLIGEGTLKKNVVNLVDELGLKNKVIFLGKREDMPNILSALDMFLFPSFYEGFPNAVLEAQACGLPCLISDKITEEVVIDNYAVKQLPIDCSSYNDWVKRVVFFSSEKFNNSGYVNDERGDAWKKIKEAGFSNKEEVIRLEALYESKRQ
jgi:glycosyltransferase involved in cell wall biosynthesis